MTKVQEFFSKNFNIETGNLFSIVFTNPIFISERIIIILSCLGSFSFLFINTTLSSCQLTIFQNLIIPIICAWSLQPKIKIAHRKSQLQVGAIMGIITGALPATVTFTIDNLQYYLAGDREKSFLAMGQPIPPLTVDEIITNILVDLVLLVLLLFLSLIGGLFGTSISSSANKLFRRRNKFL